MKSLFTGGALVLATLSFAVDKWDFEYSDGVYTHAVGTGAPGGYTSQLLSSITDLTHSMRLTRTSGAAWDMAGPDTLGNAGLLPASWGRGCFDPFARETVNDYMQAEFLSATYGSVSIDFGDFGGDIDNIVLEAWSSVGGSLLATATYNNYNFATVTPLTSVTVTVTSNSPIGMVRFRGGDANFPNSMYMDNIVAGPVPEPATFVALGGGIALLARRKRK
ncbi:MAG: PEP-CTERM sorting domain-containing protein [Chthonomonas sp.]|nr:PEP-CTERM sorting domain-containing protein [Chthonomonas sp.]